MILYNLNDCLITMQLVNAKGMTDEIISLCQSSKSPVEDVCLFKTGAIAWNFVMAENFNRDIKCIWPEESSPFKFTSGGQVFFDGPSTIGKHIVLDYDSLYPSIIIAGNISPDGIVVNEQYKTSSSYSDENSLKGRVIVDWNDNGMEISLENDKSVSMIFPYNIKSEGMMPRCCKTLMNRKELANEGNKGQANNCKLVNNSIYGALACLGYPSYSPITASATTACSRYALEILFLVSYKITGCPVFL